MFCKILNVAKTWLFIMAMTFCTMTAAAQGSTDSVVDGELIEVSADTGHISFYDAGEQRQYGSVGMIVPMQSTIVTEERQRSSLVIRRDDEPVIGIIISEVTDFYYDYDSKSDVFYIELHYGRVRIVADRKIRIEVESEYGRASMNGGDFGIISIIKDDGTVYEGIYDFDGHLSCESKIIDAETVAERWDRFDTFAGDKSVFSEQELLWWQDAMLFDLTLLPKEIPYILEDLCYPQRQDILIANYVNLTTDEKQELAGLILAGIFRFHANYFMFADLSGINNGLNISWLPGGIFMERKLEFSLDMSVSLNMSAIITGDTDNIIHKANAISNKSGSVSVWDAGNNPWSFGSDQGGNTGRIVFDAADDLFLKLGLLRYGFDKPSESVFVQVGKYFDVSDRWGYSLSGFFPQSVSHNYRHTSYATKINTRIFETFIYAEDIMPKGLYGLSMKFMTPAKSIRLKAGFSVFADMYSLIQFGGNSESVVPMQNNANLEFTLFDLPSFGFDLYINGGLNIPFSYNFVSGESFFVSAAASKNAATLFTNIAADLGMSMRFKHFYLVPEFIVDTEYNRVGLYDAAYIGHKRVSYFSGLLSWLSKPEEVSISKFFFGGRLKMMFNNLEYVKFELSYQATASYNDAHIGIDWLYYCFYDKFYLSVKADTGKKYTVGFNFDLTYQIEHLAASLADAVMSGIPRYLLLNQIAYMTFTLSPYHAVDIYFRGGVCPSEAGLLGMIGCFAQIGATVRPNEIVRRKDAIR